MMLMVGPIGFAAPWVLLALTTLPILWLILRAIPPAPIRRRFPGVALLLGLTDEDQETDRTPWWLLLLRMLAVALVILGFARPILNPDQRVTGTGPLLIVIDGTWADARDWQRRLDRAGALLDEAARDGRTVAMVQLTDLPPDGLTFQPAEAWATRLPTFQPRPFVPAAEAISGWWADQERSWVETFWLSDGLDHPWREVLLDTLRASGPVTAFQTPAPVTVLRPAQFDEGNLLLSGSRSTAGTDQILTLLARGLDPNGTPRVLARAEIFFDAAANDAETRLSLPPELRNRVTRFEIEGVRSAGAVTLTDDALRRREVALIAGIDDREGLELLSPLHYLEQALEPTADLIGGALTDIIPANPDAIVFADVARLSMAEENALLEWIEDGGILVRFAGPRLAASDLSRDSEDPLMPVRLRAGGRNVGGAMSWGEPKGLRDFTEDSPFFGLAIPEEVRVSAQVMAQPDPTLGQRTIASLQDGTPLVTRKRVGDGQIVLFHTTANAEWSTLPLSGIFVQMLERLAVSTRPDTPSADDLAGTVWVPDQILTAQGDLADAGTMPGVPGEALVDPVPSADLSPGLYAGEDQRIAINAVGRTTPIRAASWPADVVLEGLDVTREIALSGYALALALLILFADVIASLWIGGRISGLRPTAVLALLFTIGLAAHPAPTAAQSEDQIIEATTEVVLAHVVTGDPSLDQLAQAGLRGLGDVLYERTSVEPAEPIAVDLEEDELSFFPLLYWPISPNQPIPSEEAYAKLNTYLRTGGMIVFDTRDADIAAFGQSTAGRRLQEIARPLDIPPLEPVPEDHVLTRTFYLLKDFPGRYLSREVWVEAAPADAERLEGMPFRNLNDNVTPVIIGGNDWAAAWAVGENGGPLYPVGRGFAGERQREVAYRFGVNLVIHVLTGNYKSDQVHVPALLDRLGQ